MGQSDDKLDMMLRMHVYFIGIGGTAIGPLAMIAKQAGYIVSGSDKQDSNYVSYLKSKGIKNINIGNDDNFLAELHQKEPVDLIVYSSAVAIENPNHPELVFAKNHDINAVKRDGLLNKIINENDLKLAAVAGTHGKTTTTAMLIWLFKCIDIPISYSVGAKIPFGDMGNFDTNSKYFIYECDEFDRNFLAFHPYISLITGIDHDHHEHYPTIDDYQQAFKEFVAQSKNKLIWQEDANKISTGKNEQTIILDESEPVLNTLSIPGLVNRKDAWQVIQAVHFLTKKPIEELVSHMEKFPGVSRRFEKIIDNLYTDYAHTIPKIKGCLQLASEVSKDVVIVYEPLTNRRQHYIRDEYNTLFKDVKKLYWVPSYLAREDSNQSVIAPQEFIDEINEPADKQAAELNDELKEAIKKHLEKGDTVVCLSGGGGGSLDEWLRTNFKSFQ